MRCLLRGIMAISISVLVGSKFFVVESRPLSHDDQVIASGCFFCTGDDALQSRVPSVASWYSSNVMRT